MDEFEDEELDEVVVHEGSRGSTGLLTVFALMGWALAVLLAFPGARARVARVLGPAAAPAGEALVAPVASPAVQSLDGGLAWPLGPTAEASAQLIKVKAPGVAPKPVGPVVAGLPSKGVARTRGLASGLSEIARSEEEEGVYEAFRIYDEAERGRQRRARRGANVDEAPSLQGDGN